MREEPHLFFKAQAAWLAFDGRISFLLSSWTPVWPVNP